MAFSRMSFQLQRGSRTIVPGAAHAVEPMGGEALRQVAEMLGDRGPAVAAKLANRKAGKVLEPQRHEAVLDTIEALGILHVGQP